MDERQASITFQNQSHLAFEILKFNKSLTGEQSPINPKDVVELALKLTRIAVNPVPHMKKQVEGE
jgi:hypothetical protein